MKKYIFSILFFLGCFFLCSAVQTNLVHAEGITYSIEEDEYDSRIITIKLQGINARTTKFRVHEVEEVETCESGDTTCSVLIIGGEEKKLKFLNPQDEAVEFHLAQPSVTAEFTYTIDSDSDGDKLFYIEAWFQAGANPNYSCLVEYTLTTLSQRVVVNPDGNGNALHVYNHMQYSPSRVLSIQIDLLEDEIDNVYSGEVYIFEENVNKYSYWIIGNEPFDFGLESYGDGIKNISIYLVKKDVVINENANVLDQLNSPNEAKAKKISKKIHLDTIGPEITIPGGTWVVIPQGEKYSPSKEAPCKDAVFTEDACYVSHDADIVRIDYTTDRYQTVTYEATDRLGNTKTLSVRIKVEQNTGNGDMTLVLLISGAVLAITVGILAYILIKNSEKKKKISYI